MADTDARFRSLFESTPDVIVIMDDRGILVDANAALERVLGYTPAELIGKPLSEIMPERYREGHRDGLARYLSTGERKLDWRSIELPGLTADGREIQLAVAFGEYEENGRRFFTGILRDVSADKSRMALLDFLSRVGPELASSELDYRATLTKLAQMAVPFIADWSAVDVISQDATVERLAVAHADHAKLRLVADIAERYPSDPDATYGVAQVIRSGKPEMVSEIPLSSLESAARDEEHLAIIKSLGLRSYLIVPLAAHGRVYGALSLVHAESGRCFSEADVPLMEELGRRAGLAVHNAGLYTDALAANRLLEEQATELEQQTEEAQALAEELEQQTQELMSSAEELRRATEEASAANQAKSAFLASMSHELRTPLNAIGGYVELLEMGLRGPLTDEQKSDLERIRVSQRHLLALINDLLNFARVEAGRIEYRIERVLLSEALADCETMLVPQMKSRGITYSVETCDRAVWVRADNDKVHQIVLNLLSNAAKFTPEGGRISTSCHRVEGEGRIDITDTGIGIDRDAIESIFEPFVQINRTLNQPGSGAGLGLAISRTLARGMGGDIIVSSEPGVGSTFTLKLPLFEGA